MTKTKLILALLGLLATAVTLLITYFTQLEDLPPPPPAIEEPAPTPEPEPAPVPPPLTVGGGISAVWANDGGDKVTQEERRATANPSSVMNKLWDGNQVKVFGARNEVVGFNLVLEAKGSETGALEVRFDTLTGPNGAEIKSVPTTGDGVFNWTQRPIELFYVRYLEIKGLSLLSYDTSYDERHIPKRFRRQHNASGIGSGSWSDRPDANKFYPEIAVPMEWSGAFKIPASKSQSVWADIYIPKTAAPGTYTGTVSVLENGAVSASIPVQLRVRNFVLPDEPASKTMLFLGYADISRRYTGTAYPNDNTAQATRLRKVRDRHFLVAHRHKISIIDSHEGPEVWSQDAPRAHWVGKLNGSFFTAENGYAGPGEGVGNNVFSVGTYGSWNWKTGNASTMKTRAGNWEKWFRDNSPTTERFLYLIDESTNYSQTEQWAGWAKGVIDTFATLNLPSAVNNVPSLNIAASWFAVAPTSWGDAHQVVLNDPTKRFYMYNGKRPASGSFATEDDGVALRQVAWAQYKMKVHRWFFWESTYYNNYQGGTGQTNVFQSAHTFGGNGTVNNVRGQTGWNHSNGDGVLFYPGIDTVFPAESYGMEGPIASLRMKLWRRGIQDVDYIALAAQKSPARVQQIVNAMVPKALWEYGVSDPNDPTWTRTDVSWSVDPDAWEAAREELADIIEQ